jgi:transposase
MEKVTTIGLDLAKSVFQVHGVDAAGGVVVRRKLRRSALLEFFAALPPTLVGMEACGGAHHWARELTRLGHTVRLMPPAYVKPYVKQGKTDAADAEAICEAVTRPTMRFVPATTEAQQASLMELKVRDMLVRQRTQTVNALRSHLAEYGIVAAQGRKVAELIAVVRDGDDVRLPALVRAALGELVAQIEALEERIARLGHRMIRHAREDETARRLASIPGIGAIGATALAAMVPDPQDFASVRHFAASLGPMLFSLMLEEPMVAPRW